VLHQILSDENVGWPSYVDFLSTFLFILVLFVAWSVNLMAGVEKERKIHNELTKIQKDFQKKGFEAVIEGHKLRIPLRNKVIFSLNKSDLDDDARRHLQEAGRMIAAYPDVRRIIVSGYADKIQPRHDPFFNWRVSVERAETVLHFLYSCTECEYRPEDIRPKLVLRGEGDLDARLLKLQEQQTGEAGDRRVDIILDTDKPDKDKD
jgi:flagellar motor protein MotB